MTRGGWEHLLSLGSNVDPDRWVDRAVAWLRARFDVAGVSPAYDVPAVGGGAGTPDFVNLAVRLCTDLPPRPLRVVCRHLEERCGRRRGADRFAPRTLDLDVVYSLGPDRRPAAHADLETEPYVLVPCADAWPEAALATARGERTLAGLAREAWPRWRDAHVRREARP